MTRARESAVIVPVELPSALERLRLAYVPVGLLGVPAHVTLLSPFIPPSRIRATDVAALRRVLEPEVPFEFELSTTRAFPAEAQYPGTTYLAPEPPDRFVRLTHAIWDAFPDYPPFEGAYDAIVPHVTIADDASRLGEVDLVGRTVLPFRQTASEAWLVVEGDDGRWTRRARLPIGRAGARAGSGRGDRRGRKRAAAKRRQARGG